MLTLPPAFQCFNVGSGIKQADRQKKPEKGELIRLSEGTYTTAQLAEAGIPDKSLETVKVNAGWTVTLYEKDDFAGNSVTCTAFVRTLGCEEFRFSRRTSSLKISKAAIARSTN